MTTPLQLPFEQVDPLQVTPQLRELLATGHIHRVRTEVGDPAWLVTHHADVRRLLDDERLGRAHPEPETAPRSSESALFGGPMGNFATEHTDHTRMRALLQPHFTPRHMRNLRTHIETLSTSLLDELTAQGSPADLHSMLAVPLPILVICELLGVPYEDRDRFRAWTTAAANTRDHAASEDGLAQLHAYGRQLVAVKRRTPTDDVISRLCATDGVSDDEAAELSMALLFAGHETTVVQIGLTAVLLMGNPEEWQALVDEPALVPKAIEETLRASRRGGGVLPRYVRTDLEIGGVTVKAGELVLLEIGASNHDPDVFADPDRVDVNRSGANHLAFGHGARYCLGAPLARIELQTVFTQLVSRFPTMRLAVDTDELTVRPDSLAGGLTELPVQW
ncbi:cytochrome P450 [Mycobacterium sp. MMS18-G62]